MNAKHYLEARTDGSNIPLTLLFTPVRVGRIALLNRLVMAPMTLSRADELTGVPTVLVAIYYRQRAEAGGRQAGPADATVFGSALLANPDLPARFRQGAALNTPDKTSFALASGADHAAGDGKGPLKETAMSL